VPSGNCFKTCLAQRMVLIEKDGNYVCIEKQDVHFAAGRTAGFCLRSSRIIRLKESTSPGSLSWDELAHRRL